MKNNTNISVVLLCITALLCSYVQTLAAPKREMRNAWVATVWALDWPKSWGGGDANVLKQQEELVALIDSLHNANFNGMALQVRSMSDAMYNSKYEPWSQYLTGVRGGVPQYDPLQLAVEETHKRGMEMHVWINPYRYATSSSTYGNLDTDYSHTHPEWLLTVGEATILNPGLPEVKERIASIVADILDKYDIDGVLFDDYFYLSGTPASADATLYQNSNPQGLSLADWRREQVNEMVRMVHDTIQAKKPWVTFGIGPAPQVASSAAHAAKYGVEPCPFSDWQYNSIFSDPLAWISRHTVDYVTPQAYWPMNGTYSFGVFSEWWAKVAEKFHRHVYMSHSTVGPSGSTVFAASEMAAQVNKLREDDKQCAPGSVFYSIYNGISKRGWVQDMRRLAYPTPALPPQKAWLIPEPSDLVFVTNVRYANGKLMWFAPADANVRYAVYMLPSDSLSAPGTFYNSRWLLGISYTTSYPVTLQSGYTFAVAVLDRYGNEHPPVLFNRNTITDAQPATLTFPAEGDNPLLPVFLTWQQNGEGDTWFVQIATDSLFTDIVAYVETGETHYYTGKLSLLETNRTYWWRVRTRGLNMRDAWSAPRSFVGNQFSLNYPFNGATNVALSPTLECDSVMEDDVTYTFEIASATTFAQNKVVFTALSAVPHVSVPTGVLSPSTMYYARVAVQYGAAHSMSDPVEFKTERMPVSAPVILSPADGDTISGTNVVVTWQEQNVKGFRIELSTTESFSVRTTTIREVSAYTYSYTFTNTAPGSYYLCVRAYDEGNYVNSDVITLTVLPATGQQDVNADTGKVEKQLENGEIVIVMPDGSKYTILGSKIER
ncbi:MAG: family 10 glycosylhydrolase [Paludibacteraceae bacterium]|nr:family 10 glycosylhydrolase [Paludibacteraceae bacterium]